MKTENYHANWFQQIVEFGRTRPWVPLIGLIYIFLATFAFTRPEALLTPELNIQLGLSFSAFLLLTVTGLYLLSNNYKSVWGVSFLLYAISFLGICLKVLNFPFTDITNPIIFHLWLLPLVFFVSGVWIGISHLILENRKFNYFPALFILLLSEGWFFAGLFILDNIPLALFGFNYGLFVPVALMVSYIWFRFGRVSDSISPWLLAFGFLLMVIINLFWSPWLISDLDKVYSVLLALFDVSLVVILSGFLILTKDLIRIKHQV
ncbi:MAG: hypothetical protein ACFFB5_09720 [Promethearchaeota archaeon]